MIKFSAATQDDLSQIGEWIKEDPDHSGRLEPEWWLTGAGGLVAGCIEDEHGPAMYFRIDMEGDAARLHCQFAPLELVSKRRAILTIAQALPKLKQMAIGDGAKGFIFESESSSLINFMYRIGFNRVLDTNDYFQLFEEK